MPSTLISLPLLFLHLFYLPLSLGCYNGNTSQCYSASFVPGFNLVGEGFDVVKMENSGAKVVDVETFMNGGQCRLCFNSYLNKVQKLPTSVLDWTVENKCKRSVTSKLLKTGTDVMKSTSNSLTNSWKVGLNVHFMANVAVGGTQSKTFTFANSHMKKDNFFFTSHEFNCKYYSFRLKSNPPRSKDFMNSLQSLPARYDSNTRTKFLQFIDVYGTHFIRRVTLGGHVLATTAFRTCEMAMNGLSESDVSRCLNMEASATIKGVTPSVEYGECKAKSRKLKASSFSSFSHSERVTEVTGGDSSMHDILFNPSGPTAYKNWMVSLKKNPGLVAYTLTSLHSLVYDANQRSNLQRAITDYIQSNSVLLTCPACKKGRKGQGCQCTCQGNSYMDSNCCSTQPGIAELTVTVIRAAGLWGDYTSKTDAYVKLAFGTQKDETPLINNSDFPYWNHIKHFGTVDLTRKMKVTFEVWDKDHGWDDDLLGKGSFVPTQNSKLQKSFRLNHGEVFLSYSAECGPNLTGRYCEKYLSMQDSQSKLGYEQGMLGYMQMKREEEGEKPTLQKEAGGVKAAILL